MRWLDNIKTKQTEQTRVYVTIFKKSYDHKKNDKSYIKLLFIL
jgi:hypothetical protein